MSELRSVATTRAPAALGPYSQAIMCDGWVYCAGQIPLVPESGEIVEGGIAEQADRVLRNLTAVLDAAGCSLRDVLKTTVFLVDLGEFGAMNEAYSRHFGDHRPARSTIQVAALPRGSRVEIECVARVPSGRP